MSGGQLAGPANVAHATHAAFVRRALDAVHAAVPTSRVRTVVREVEHNRVVAKAQFIEFRQHAADVPVLVLDHRQRAARFVQCFLFGVGGSLVIGLCLNRVQYSSGTAHGE